MNLLPDPMLNAILNPILNPIAKTAPKCSTCPYRLGIVQTLVDPCPRCTGKTSIFAHFSTLPPTGKIKAGGKNSR